MTTIADNIGTQFFQLSTVGVGALAVGVMDIRQCIDLILRTMPGTDPFRPEFGCNAYKFTDKPYSVAVPNIKKEVYEALSIWETRIEVLSIPHEVIDSQLIFNVTYKIIDDNVLDTITYTNGLTSTTNNSSGSVILSSAIPSKISNGVYQSILTLDGKAAIPGIPESGFQSSSDMLVWINANWYNYGRWYIAGNVLYLYLKNGIANKVFLNVTETAFITIQQLIPVLDPGTFFNLQLVTDGQLANNPFPINQINNIEDLILWVNQNWSNYGKWTIITETGATSGGDFTDDFNLDFDSNNPTSVDYYLVFQSNLVTSASLTFI